MEPLVSIIITTKNEEKNIENCLESVKKQDYPSSQIEIIVVDNDSTDKTQEIARKYADKVLSLEGGIELGTIKNPRGAQINLGVDKARGELIFFPDADMTFEKELLSDAARKMKNADALYVPEKISGKGYLGKIRNFERSFYNETCIDGVRFVKRDVFLRIGGFDEKYIMFGPDDWDFTKKMQKDKFSLGTTEKCLFHHEEQMTWRRYLRKKQKYSEAFEGYIEKWGKSDPDIKKQFGVYYRFLGVFIENGKWKKLLCHPALALGMYFLKFLVGIRFLLR